MASLARGVPGQLLRASATFRAAVRSPAPKSRIPAGHGMSLGRWQHTVVAENPDSGLAPYARLACSVSQVPLEKQETETAEIRLSNGFAVNKNQRKALKVHHEGRGYQLHSIFLRDQCNCEYCVDQYSGQKNFETADIPSNIEISDPYLDPINGTVTFSWVNDVPGFPNDHITQISEESIEQWCNNFKTTAPELEFSTWDNAIIGDKLEFVDYDAFMHNESRFSEAVRSLQAWGMVFVNNVPRSEKSVEAIGEKFGLLRNTFYGRTWDVKDVVEAQNVAYTAKHLELHMDLLYMRQPPGFQLLHCLNSSNDGGVSLFADSYHAARVISEQYPTAFDDLCRFPISYSYQKGGNWYEDTKPVFEMAPFTRESPSLPRHRYIRAVNWSPPFQGPMKINTGVEDRGHMLENWLRAAKVFRDLISADENTYTYKMEPGQCVIFNNRRVLHGRTAFSNNAGSVQMNDRVKVEPRWLKGAYIDTQDFESTYKRVMAHGTNA